MTRPPPSAALIERLKALLGPRGWSQDPAVLAPHLVEWRDRFRGSTPLLVLPATTDDVARVVALCAAERAAIVPQGGNTGLVGGQIPTGPEILLSLKRLTRIRSLDPVNDTMTVEAGAILADVQAAAEAAGRLFPLSLAAEGSCTIGGTLSTNAGGTAVLRYGNARELTLGLEVVLADGQVWNGLRGLRKDNTGYDLKQLFIGAEGTLGVITAATLKLFPRPRAVATAFVAVGSAAATLTLLDRLRRRAGETLTAFEVIARPGLDLVLRHIPGTRDPFAAPHAWYVLAELAGGGEAATLDEALLASFSDAACADAVLAGSLDQRQALWRLRDALSEAQKRERASIKCDVSVPVSAIPPFIDGAGAAVSAACPGIRPVAFGHAGDGNIHFNLMIPEGAPRDAFLARWDELSGLVHGVAAALGGSISAEHGLGQLKRDEIRRYKSPLELALMARIKKALDPDRIMNPGKVLALPD